MTQYILASAAVSDMEAIFTYIAADNLNAAEALEADFYSTFELLAKHPNRGHARLDLTQESCLFWIVRHRYWVIYEIADSVIILRVVNAYRDLGLLFQPSIKE